MDKKDREIIYHLDKDARLTFSQLAKLTKSSQETIRYRINNLTKKEIIKKYVTIINATKLGIIPCQIFLKLQNLDEKSKEKAISSLAKEEKVAWIANLEGNYDLAIIIGAKNPLEFQEVVRKIFRLFNNQILKKTISVHMSGEFLPRDYLIDKKRTVSQNPKYLPEKTATTLNKKDKQICSLLAKDGRVSFVNIAVKMKISADSVAQRFKKLKKENIILGSLLTLNQEKTNQLYYKVLLHLTNLSKEKITNLLNKIKQNNRVLAVVETLAEWDYEIDIEVEHPNQLREFVMNLTKEFSSIIKDYESIRIINMPKYEFVA